jgi:phi13 family phage major tail protein
MPDPIENKVRFGLKKVHYSILSGTTYGTPVAVPGAVNLDLSPSGDIEKFYADDIAYYVSVANQGYEGSLEIAKIPDKMFEDVWGYTIGTTSKVLTESASAEPNPFALLFQIAGDQNEDDFVIYCCTASRPNIGSQTIEANKEPRTQSFDITAAPRADGKVCAKTTKDTPSGTKNSWFSSVFVEA